MLASRFGVRCSFAREHNWNGQADVISWGMSEISLVVTDH
jgi:hypothetical protein